MPGDVVTLTILRGDELLPIAVTLGQPDPMAIFEGILPAMIERREGRRQFRFDGIPGFSFELPEGFEFEYDEPNGIFRFFPIDPMRNPLIQPPAATEPPVEPTAAPGT